MLTERSTRGNREVENVRNDRDNPADILLKKMMKDSRGKLKNTRRDMI